MSTEDLRGNLKNRQIASALVKVFIMVVLWLYCIYLMARMLPPDEDIKIPHSLADTKSLLCNLMITGCQLR